MSTAVYPELSTEYAMSLGGASSFDALTRESFARFAVEANMAPALVLNRLDALLEHLMPEAEKLAASLDATHPSSVYAKILAVIKERQGRVQRTSG